jgi:hypothetical protein
MSFGFYLDQKFRKSFANARSLLCVQVGVWVRSNWVIEWDIYFPDGRGNWMLEDSSAGAAIALAAGNIMARCYKAEQGNTTKQ